MTTVGVLCPRPHKTASGRARTRLESCPKGRLFDSPGVLSAHLHEDHGLLPSKAMAAAREAFQKAVVTSEAPADVVSGPAEPPDAGSATAASEPAAPPKKKYPWKSRGPCKVCRRVAPDKCRRHGGPPHSNAFRGQNTVAARLRRLLNTIERGKEAEVELAAVRKTLESPAGP